MQRPTSFRERKGMRITLNRVKCINLSYCGRRENSNCRETGRDHS